MTNQGLVTLTKKTHNKSIKFAHKERALGRGKSAAPLISFVILSMNKLTRIIIVSSVIAFIGTFTFSVITSEGVTYSPGISTTEMDSMSYTDASELMASRAQKITAYEFISSSIATSWFWVNFFQLWLVMVTVSTISFVVTEKWQNE